MKMLRLRLGLSTLLSLVAAYILIDVAQERGWTFIALLAKIYLYGVIGIFVLLFGLLVVILLVLFLATRNFNKSRTVFKTFYTSSSSQNPKKKRSNDNIIDAEYKIKEEN